MAIGINIQNFLISRHWKYIICHQVWLNMSLRTKVTGQNPLQMVAILKSKIIIQEMIILKNIGIVFFNFLVLKTYDLPPNLMSYVARNQSYKPKSIFFWNLCYWKHMICHQVWVHMLFRTNVIEQNLLEMAAILKSKMAAIRYIEKNATNGFLIAEGLLFPMIPKKASLAKKKAHVWNPT